VRKLWVRKLYRYFAPALFCAASIAFPNYCAAAAADDNSPPVAENPRADAQPASRAALDSDSAGEPQGPRKARTGTREAGLVGIGIHASLLGPGAEVGVSLASKLNVRGGVNFFQYNRTFNHDGVSYKGQLQLRSGELHLDFYPFGHGFHLSPGLLVYNDNNLHGNANVPGGSSFTLGSTTYVSDPTNPIAGAGKLDFAKAAPTALFGFGNLVPRSKHFATNFEMGVVFQGAARTKLNLTGSACDASGLNCVNAATDPGVQANIAAEQTKINNKLSPFKYYPIISFGFGYRF
jgi:hypothetical protein